MGGASVEFVAEMRRDGNLVGADAVTPGACFEDALFRGVLEGRFPNDGNMPEFTVVPTLTDSSPPMVSGLTLNEGGVPAGRYGLSVFAPQARAVLQRLLREGRVESGEHLEWNIALRELGPSDRRFSARTARSPYPLRPESLPDVEPGSLAVEIEAGFLNELRDEVVAAGTVECAGILLGHLLHDADRGGALVRVTGKIGVEAGPGGASHFHFAFGPQSFQLVRREAERLNDGTVPVGWVHTHPPCSLCVDRTDCDKETVGFSADDEQVHATAFGGGYMLALVAGKLGHLPATRPGFRLYGWEKGCVAERGFEIAGAYEE
jgi:proteasome lid subunit RPN8/RPN11